MDRPQAEIKDYAAAPVGLLRIGCTLSLTEALVVAPVGIFWLPFPK
jgi:hypothetical protein